MAPGLTCVTTPVTTYKDVLPPQLCYAMLCYAMLGFWLSAAGFFLERVCFMALALFVVWW